MASRVGLGVALLALMSPGAAVAQQAPTRAGEPARIEERLQLPAPKPGDVALPRPAPPTAAAPEGRRFVLSGVSVTGATVFSAAELAPLYEPLLGREVGPAEIQQIVEAITQKYRSAGYVLSRAAAPPQDADFGVLRIDVIEGYVERVAFEGSPGGGQAQLENLAERIIAERPLTLATMERYLLLIGDLPGVRAAPGVAPLGELSPAHELVVRIDRDLVEAYAALDNRGSRTVGRHIGQAAVRFNSALGFNEATTFRALTVPSSPQELIFAQIREQVPVGSDGATLALDGWRSEIEAGASLAPFDVDSVDDRIALDFSYPWLRSRDASIYLVAQLEYRDSTQDVFGASFFDDRIRSARLGVRLFFDDRWNGSSFVSVVVSRGLDVAGASDEGDPLLSRFDGDPQYSKVAFEASRRQRVHGPLSLQTWISGQATGSRVLSAEEFRLGGGVYGRAYDPSELVGEDGIAGAIEAQWDLPAPAPELSNLQAYAFWDAGAVWDDVAGTGSSRESLASAGFGLRGSLFDDVAAYVEAAKPLTREVAEEGDAAWRLFFSLGLTF